MEDEEKTEIIIPQLSQRANTEPNVDQVEMPEIVLQDKNYNSRPSALKNLQVLRHQATIKPKYECVDWQSGVLATMTIIASLGAAIYLLYTRSDCDQDDIIEKQFVLYYFSLFFAFLIRWGTFLARWTQFAQDTLSQERYFLNKSFVSCFFTLHLMPLVMIDENWDPINPVFEDQYYNLARVPMVLLVLYGVSILLWVILFIVGQKIKAGQCQNFPEVLEKGFRALTWLLFVLAIFTIFVIFSAIQSEIPLVYIELVSSLYYLVRTLIAAIAHNRFCFKYKSDDKNTSYQEALEHKNIKSLERKRRESEIDPATERDGCPRMDCYRTMEVKPSLNPLDVKRLHRSSIG